jgi:hypothetical protein
MVGGSMSVLDTAARYREVLLYNRYQAGRDNIELFKKEPPFAYIIPSTQRDVPEAALLAQKMIDNGLEVHQASAKFPANGREYPAGSWVILMDQPYSPLAKELFERQKYPQGDDGKALDHRPYDVTGWTLPLQMGVEVTPVTTPLTDAQRASLKLVSKASLSDGEVSGDGKTYFLDSCQNLSYRAVNEVFAAGGTVAFAAGKSKDCGPDSAGFVITGIDRAKMASLAKTLAINVPAVTKVPTATPVHKARVGLYRPWTASLDEGWTRWLLKTYGFAPVSLYNADIQAGHLRERFNVIVIPDVSRKQMVDGFPKGLLPGEYAGGLGDEGVEALREFVQEGGTLVALNQSAAAFVELLHLPVKNTLQDVKPDQFNCPGALLKVKTGDAPRPVLGGSPAETTVMFERGPAFETLTDFQGEVLASYNKDVNPLESGFILHGELLQGKSAALEVAFGKGRIFLFGFKPQWRGQSHGTYKLLFAALYDYEGLPPYPPPQKPPAPKPEPKPAETKAEKPAS